MKAPHVSGAEGKRRTAVIIGAGPAGLTAALELLRRTDILPVVLESTGDIGGLSRTVEHHGNRIDIGGHRFFSKSDRVMEWWQDLLPLEGTEVNVPSTAPAVRNCHPERSEGPAFFSERQVSSEKPSVSQAADAGSRETLQSQADPDAVLLLRPRQSRIYFLRRFFSYPLALTADTLRKLGPRRTLRIACSYLRARLRPTRPERNLADFLVNRFGRELYRTFFQSYTEKLWGVPCTEISADWGAQRIRGLSLSAAVRDCLRPRRPAQPTLPAKPETETSLIDRFLYPRLGPGQMWQHAAAEIRARGGVIHHNTAVDRLCITPDAHRSNRRITGVEATCPDGSRETFAADFVLSTMPVPALVRSLSEPAPAAIRTIADGLVFRDFLTVGVLARRLALTEPGGAPLRDNWIYIQEPGVRMTRLQLFHNWSPGMVADPATVWLGLEYVCSEHDDLWHMPDDALARFATAELASIGMLQPADVLDTCIVRAPKAYPAYFGTYSRFDEVRQYLGTFQNLYPIGRNGQHRYNNQDHSMLTAMLAVDSIASGTHDPAALWSVNTEQTHHESR